MFTQYSEIYDVFLSQIDDPIFFNGDINDDIKLRYLLNSIPKFKKCRQDLSNRTDNSNTFNIVLTDEEIQVLGNQMVVEYLSPRIIAIKKLTQFVSNKDFQMTSQAQQLKALSDIRKDKRKEVDNLIITYSYNNPDLSVLS